MKSLQPPNEVELYLAGLPAPVRATLESVRAAILAAVPAQATECLHYGMPAFRYHGALVCYAAFQRHCSFFPLDAALIDRFSEELAGYSTSKGTIRFPLDEPLPAALIKQIVRARVKTNEARASV